MLMIFDPDDVMVALRLLETEPTIHSWEIGRIRNQEHALSPRGEGFGLTLLHWKPAHGLAPQLVQVWEKAGDGVSLEAAVKRGIERLRAEVVS